MKLVFAWMSNRLSQTSDRDNRISAWLILLLWAASTFAASVHAVGNPTGASIGSRIWDIGKFAGLNSLLFLIATLLLAGIFSLLYIPLPRLALGGFLYASAVHVAVLRGDESGVLFSYVIGVGFSVTVMVIGIFFILMMRRKASRLTLLAILLVAGAASTINLLSNDSQEALQVDSDDTKQASAENPGEPGDHDYTFLTYGSGNDLQRESFGDGVNEVSSSVDASDWITDWDEKKQEFWGFDSSNLPVNGRAWVPEGEGPFPVMLMVHGNHTMEDFSTDGYDYLGELLASQGFIAISVDEDFVNYSNVSGSPNDNYKLRAWLILQHINQLQDMNADSKSAFHQKIDFGQVALMGHSRGGQAALMAADYESYFDDDSALMETMDQTDIKGVVTLAPTDTTVDDKKPHLHNTSYLFLGGARDADVSDFRGDRQFYRTTFDPDDDGFKSTLYIGGANHTQFNTSWGERDLSMPRGLFLSQAQMEPDEQRQIAKVYMGAFMENIFHDEDAYTDLFKDYRDGNEWLPDTKLVNKYRDAAYTPVTRFDRDDDDEIGDFKGFENADVQTPEDRGGSDRLTDALQLEWKNSADYSLDLGAYDLTTRTGETPQQIVLTMANDDNRPEDARVPDIDVELETKDGKRDERPLEEFFPFPEVISTDYTAFGLFDDIFRDGQYKPSWEPVFQTFPVPVDAFKTDDGTFEMDDVATVKLHFHSHPGKIYVEEIGVR